MFICFYLIGCCRTHLGGIKMTKKPLYMTAIGALALLALTGCGEEKTESTTEQSQPETTTKPVYNVTHNVGIDTTYPPYAFLDEHGVVVGFEPEILQAIAEDQKFGLELLHAPRNTLYPDLESNKYQILAASLNPNPERQAQSELSEPYAKSQRVILTYQDRPVASQNDLKSVVVAVQESTNSHRVLSDLGIQTQSHPSLFKSFQSLMTHKADYVVGDKIPLEYYLNNHSKTPADYKFVPFDPSAGSSPVVFAIQKGNIELLTQINTGLNNIKANGKYNQIYQKWFKNADASVN